MYSMYKVTINLKIKGWMGGVVGPLGETLLKVQNYSI